MEIENSENLEKYIIDHSEDLHSTQKELIKENDKLANKGRTIEKEGSDNLRKLGLLREKINDESFMLEERIENE